MTESDMNDPTPESKPDRHLGFRIAVGVAGLVLLVLFMMLGWVASKQSATQKALENHESLQATPDPTRVETNP